MSQADRTLPATPRRREAARRQGLMPLASLPAWVATVATTLVLLPAWAAATFPAAQALVRQSIVTAVRGGGEPLLPGAAAVFLPTVVLVGVAGVAGLAVRVIVDGVAWRPQRLVPTWARVDPLAGLGRILSASTLAAAGGAACGLALMVAVAACAVGPLVALLGGADTLDGPGPLLAAAQRCLLPLAAAAAVVAASSWGAARLRFERRIRMTPEEFADEARGMQADPKVVLRRHEQARRRLQGGP